MVSNRYEWGNIYHADETGLTWKAMPTNTLALRSEKEAPGYKLPKDRLTVMVCTNATGTHKLPLQVIGKSKKPRCFKNVNELPVVYAAQLSAWMDRGIFRNWYSKVFHPEVHKNKEEDAKFLLILDNAPSHPNCMEFNARDPSCQVVYLPKNVTALMQPMDQGVIQTLKNEYGKRFLGRILYASEQGAEEKAEFLKSWNVLECCRTFAAAWNCIGTEGIKNAWHKIGSNFDTLETTRLTNNQNLARLANRISPEKQFSEKNIKDWLNNDISYPNFRMLSDTEIVHHAGNFDSLYESEQYENGDMDPDTEEDSRNSFDHSQDSTPSFVATKCQE